MGELVSIGHPEYPRELTRHEMTIRDRWEGRIRNYNIGNRVGGLAMGVFGMILSRGDSLFLDLGSMIFMLEGFSDMFTGNHHYLSSRVYEGIVGHKIWEERQGS